MAFTFPSDFNPQPSLQGSDINLSPLREEDRDRLAEAASDPEIWAGHPAQNRYSRVVFDPYFNLLLSSGSALVIRDTEESVIGCTVYYSDTNAPSRLSIGFTFLTRACWGGKINRIVKRLTLGHIFATKSEAWFHIARSNMRSQTATKRLGAIYTHEAKIDLGGGEQTWGCYCLTRENWDINDNQ